MKSLPSPLRFSGIVLVHGLTVAVRSDARDTAVQASWVPNPQAPHRRLIPERDLNMAEISSDLRR